LGDYVLFHNSAEWIRGPSPDPRGDKNPITTINASRDEVTNAAKRIYKNYPKLLKSLGF